MNSKELAEKFFRVYKPPDAQWFVDTALIPGLTYFFDEARLLEAEWWAEKCGHRGPARPQLLDNSCEMCVRIVGLRSKFYDPSSKQGYTTKYSPQREWDVEGRLINARTLVLMAACALVPTDGGIFTNYQPYLSLEKAVLEYRAAVRQDENGSKDS